MVKEQFIFPECTKCRHGGEDIGLLKKSHCDQCVKEKEEKEKE